MEPPSRNSKKLTAIIGLIVIIAAVAAGIAFVSNKPTEDTASTQGVTTASPTASPEPTTTVAATSSATASGYKDGTYSAQGSYQSPGGMESVSLSVTVKDGVVTATTATTTGNNPTGKRYQDMFVSGYQSQVVGKSLDEIAVSKVSGSSLTPKGFTNALEQIKSEAKA